MGQISDYLDAQGARAEVVSEIERELFEMLEARLAAVETPPAKSKPGDEPHAKDNKDAHAHAKHK
jgi:hypothetical protein